MSELLPPPQERDAQIICSYYRAVPDLSEMHINRVISVLDVETLDRVFHFSIQELTEHFQLPAKTMLRAKNGYSNSMLARDISKFAYEDGLIIGQLVCNAMSNLTGHDKLVILQEAQHCIRMLRETYAKNYPASKACPYPEDAFMFEVCNLLDEVAMASIASAFDPEIFASDPALQQAIFLAEAGAMGFLSDSTYHALCAAWATAPHSSLINIAETDSLHQHKN